jgi:hypothetical protein
MGATLWTPPWLYSGYFIALCCADVSRTDVGRTDVSRTDVSRDTSRLAALCRTKVNRANSYLA